MRADASHFLERVKTVHFGHLDVHDHEIEVHLADLLHGFLAVGGNLDDISLTHHGLAQDESETFLVVGDEDFSGGHWALRGVRGACILIEIESD